MKRRLHKLAPKITALLVLLAAGTIINLGVAWACARWSGSFRASPGAQPPAAAGFWIADRNAVKEKSRLIATGWSPKRSGNPSMDAMSPYRLYALRQSSFGIQRSACVERRDAERYDHDDPFAVTTMVLTDVGWPCLCFGAEQRCDPVKGKVAPVGYAIQVNGRGINGSARIPPIIPLRPFVLGYAVNSVFYAAILWLLMAAPIALRRWRRIRAGHCAMCAYPVGVSAVCTECGSPVAARSAVDDRR